MTRSSGDCPCVSVLVPIYNVEKYLRQCLQSLKDQTLKNIEIICINDGSKDDSLSIIKEFMQGDERFVLLDKDNSGYGDSMNQGMKKATGEYVGIVEPDDWVDEDAFEDLYRIAKEHNAEVVRANYYHHKNGRDEKIRYIPIHETGRIIDPRHHVWTFLHTVAIWSGIYRRDFLEKNDIKFLPTPGASYQDTGFSFKVWAMARKAQFTTNAYLHYRVDNENSSVNNPGKVFCVCDEYEEIERYIADRSLMDELEVVIWTAKCATYFWNALRLKPRLVKEFFQKVAPELAEADKQGLIFTDYFKNHPIEKTTIALVQGNIMAACHAVRQEKRALKKQESAGVWAKLRIHHTKQRDIDKQIAKLEAQNEVLEQQIRNLYGKMEKDDV